MSDTKYVVERNWNGSEFVMVRCELLALLDGCRFSIRKIYPDDDVVTATVFSSRWIEDYRDTPTDAVRRLVQNARRSVEAAEEELKNARDKLQDAWGFLEAFAKEIRPCP